MRKNAQGLSMNTIIIAAIALLVLVVLSVIFIGRLGIFSPATASCENKNGQCITLDDTCDGTITSAAGFACPVEEGEEPLRCCIPIQG